MSQAILVNKDNHNYHMLYERWNITNKYVNTTEVIFRSWNVSTEGRSAIYHCRTEVQMCTDIRLGSRSVAGNR
jgi:hypothetical protein